MPELIDRQAAKTSNNTGYVSVPDGMDFSTEFDTYILAFCPDSDSWFATNKRFFYYEYPKDFASEEMAIRYFKDNAKDFYDIEMKIGVYKPSFTVGAIHLDNTRETIIIDKEKYENANNWRGKTDRT